MVQAFIQLNQAAKAADAQEIVTGAHPNRNAYLNLAKLAYAAGQTRKGDLAAQKALAETPKDLRTAVKDQLDQAKKQGAGQQRAAPPASPRRRAGAERRPPAPRAPHRRLATARVPGPLAQLVEQGPLKPKVEGSIPSRPTRRRCGVRRARPSPPL